MTGAIDISEDMRALLGGTERFLAETYGMGRGWWAAVTRGLISELPPNLRAILAWRRATALEPLIPVCICRSDLTRTQDEEKDLPISGRASAVRTASMDRPRLPATS